MPKSSDEAVFKLDGKTGELFTEGPIDREVVREYEVSVEDGGQVRVKAKRSVADKGGYRLKDCPGSEKVPTGNQTVVIVGGGPAAQTCAETLRNRCG